MKYKLLKVGTDAEVFWKNQQGDPVPSLGLLPGTKHHPTTVTALGPGFTLHEDNVMPEFGIPPASTDMEFSSNIKIMLSHLEALGKTFNLGVDISASRFFLPSQLAHPQAQEFGCDPDFCIWDGAQNVINKQGNIVTQLRTAAAHVHVSFTVDGKRPTINQMGPVIKTFDLAFLPFLFIDTDRFRRLLYGKAGALRPFQYSPHIFGL